MDLWGPERHDNLAMERKKEANLQKKRIPPSSSLSVPFSHMGKDTSTAREKRRKRVEASVSGKRLNVYLDSLEVLTHLDELEIGGDI